jgi:exodeoxyribonuclease VII small subunit
MAKTDPTKTTPAASGPAADAPASFEAALAELASIVATMEGGELPLEQSLAAYSRGAQLLKYCQTQLADAQQKVRILEDDTLKLFADENHQR